jgi:hypothetical protein
MTGQSYLAEYGERMDNFAENRMLVRRKANEALDAINDMLTYWRPLLIASDNAATELLLGRDPDYRKPEVDEVYELARRAVRKLEEAKKLLVEVRATEVQ